MKIVCGLGNPGHEYADNRHNLGFQVVDRLAGRWRIALAQEKFEARIGQGNAGGDRVLLLQPQTFMNLSGKSVAGAARFFKVAVADLLIVHDELDLPFGRLQLKQGGGAGGHNGIKSILESLGEDGFARLRIGVGKPAGPSSPRGQVVGHVLSDFNAEESAALPELQARAADAAEAWLIQGLAAAMNAFNRRRERST